MLALRAPIRGWFFAPESLDGFGQAGSGVPMRALAKPVAPQVSRDDALVAWVESSARMREIGPRELEPNSGDLNESTRDVSRDQLDMAFGNLMYDAVL